MVFQRLSAEEHLEKVLPRQAGVLNVESWEQRLAS
jgi:hypothetical protein